MHIDNEWHVCYVYEGKFSPQKSAVNFFLVSLPVCKELASESERGGDGGWGVAAKPKQVRSGLIVQKDWSFYLTHEKSILRSARKCMNEWRCLFE